MRLLPALLLAGCTRFVDTHLLAIGGDGMVFERAEASSAVVTLEGCDGDREELLFGDVDLLAPDPWPIDGLRVCGVAIEADLEDDFAEGQAGKPSGAAGCGGSPKLVEGCATAPVPPTAPMWLAALVALARRRPTEAGAR